MKYRVNSIDGLGFQILTTGQYGSVGAPGSTGGSAGESTGVRCPPCPTNCVTTKKTQTYFARPQKMNDTDVPVMVNRKVVKCDDTSTGFQTDCAREIAALKKAHGLQGLQGLQGCSSCSGANNYANRM